MILIDGRLSFDALQHTGLSAWQLAAAVREQLIPDAGPPWPVDVADEIRDRRSEIVAVLGEDAPIGGNRAADRLAERTGLAVAKWDVEKLVDAKLPTIDSYYKAWPLYDCRALDAVPADALAAIVADRVAWFDASVHIGDAAEYLGWRRDEFRRVAAERDLTPDDYNRIGKAELDALAGDEDLAEQLRLDRLLTAQQAAEKLELRPPRLPVPPRGRPARAEDIHLGAGEPIPRRRRPAVPGRRSGGAAVASSDRLGGAAFGQTR